MSVELGFTANQIINENRIKREEIQEIKLWLESQPLPKFTDEQIVLFLLACDNSQVAAKRTIQAYVTIANSIPEIFTNRNVERADLQQYLNMSEMCCLPVRTDDGNAIIFNRLIDTNYQNLDFCAYCTCLTMTVESTFFVHPPNGLIILFDCKGSSIMHITRWRLNLLKAMIKYFQEGLQIKLVAAHILNTSWVVNKMFDIIRPFIKSDVMKKMHTHLVGTDMDAFYEQWIPKHCLPLDYGGDLPSAASIHKKQVEVLKNMTRYFYAEEEQRKIK